MSTLLFDVSNLDPVTYVAVVLLLVLVSIVVIVILLTMGNQIANVFSNVVAALG